MMGVVLGSAIEYAVSRVPWGRTGTWVVEKLDERERWDGENARGPTV